MFPLLSALPSAGIELVADRRRDHLRGVLGDNPAAFVTALGVSRKESDRKRTSPANVTEPATTRRSRSRASSARASTSLPIHIVAIGVRQIRRHHEVLNLGYESKWDKDADYRRRIIERGRETGFTDRAGSRCPRWDSCDTTDG